MQEAVEQATRAYAAFFEGLSPETLPGLRRLVAPDVQFRDPLHEGRGVDAMQRGLKALLDNVDDTRFAIRGIATTERTAFIAWTLTFRRKSRRSLWTITGVSEVRLDPQDRVSNHVNHWDSGGQIYEHIPMLGGLMRTIRRQISGQ